MATPSLQTSLFTKVWGTKTRFWKAQKFIKILVQNLKPLNARHQMSLFSAIYECQGLGITHILLNGETVVKRDT